MSTIDTKELKHILEFGLVFATTKTAIDYLSGRKPTTFSYAKNGGIAVGVQVVYDYGTKQKWWP